MFFFPQSRIFRQTQTWRKIGQMRRFHQQKCRDVYGKHSQTFSFPSFPCISRVLYFPIFHIKLPERGFRRYSRQVLKHVSLLISISLIYNIFSNIFSISFPYLFHQFGAAGLVPTRGRDGHQASAETALMEAINTMCLGPAEGAKQKEESATETTGKCHG